MVNLLIWCIAFAIYLLFAGTISVTELMAAGVLASLAAAWAHAIRQCSRRPFSVASEQIMPVLRAVAGLFPATLRTCATLLKAVAAGGSPGRALRCRFEFGMAEDPRARTRRAVAVLCASLAPDSFVVTADRAKGEVLIHSIDRSGRHRDPGWLHEQ